MITVAECPPVQPRLGPCRGVGMNAEKSAGVVPVNKPTRRSLRLKGFDYAQPGAYYVTVLVQKGWPLFGEVVEEQMRLNDAGKMVRQVWDALPVRFPAIELDAFVVMPNHVHGIVAITRPAGAQRADGQCPANTPDHNPVTLGDVVSAFKSLTTAEYASNVKSMKWPPFRGRLWQRGYYDHVVRDDESLRKIREYILGNPTLWALGRRHHTDT